MTKVQELSEEVDHLKVIISNSHTIWNSPLFSGIVGAITVFMLTLIYNTYRDIRDKRFQCRSFISAEEIGELGTRLEGYNYEPIDDIRLVETESLVKLNDDVKKGAISNVQANFLKIENLGPSLVTNVNITLEIEGLVSKKKVLLQKVIPIISTKQKVFILAQVMDFYVEPQLLRKTTITYMTIAREKIRYSYEVSGSEEDCLCKETYSYKRFGSFKKVSQAETKPISWIYIKHNREVT